MSAPNDGVSDPGAGRTLVPKGRFEWERLLRRLDLPLTTKAVGYTMAQYGDSDGTRIWPGMERLARVCRLSTRMTRRHVLALRESGLLRLEASGQIRHARRMADEYRLTVPADVADRPGTLTPNEDFNHEST